MKKIGILFGQENSFPQAFVDRINEKKVKGISAEFVLVDEVFQGRATDYAVILDRISQDVPFYRAYLKNAAISGTAVMNNPFWWSADEKFFNNALATKIGVPVPKTYLLPSKEMPTDTSSTSFRNLKFPLDWAHIFQEIGFPAYMKPHSGGGWKSVYKVTDVENLFQSYSETGQLVMLFQEEIKFESYFRCYCLGRKYVRIMQYEPRNPHHLRYVTNGGPVEKKLLKTTEEYVLRLNNALGYDFNTVEFAVRDGVPYAIDFCNTAPDADLFSVGQDNFDWVVENAANMAIERAQAHKDGQDNLTWGDYLRSGVEGKLIGSSFASKSTSKRSQKNNSAESGDVKTTSKRVSKAKATTTESAVEKTPAKRGPKAKATASASAVEKTPAKRGPKTKTASSDKPAAKRGPKAKATTAEVAVEKTPVKTARKPKTTASDKPVAKRKTVAKAAKAGETAKKVTKAASKSTVKSKTPKAPKAPKATKTKSSAPAAGGSDSTTQE